MNADYVAHEAYTVDTRDHEDHTFCGIMFDVISKDILPVESIDITHVHVRGALGKLTVWVTEGGHEDRFDAKHQWIKVYEGDHKPSPYTLVPLKLNQPLTLAPDTRIGLYVHSQRQDDQAIVYDNQRREVSHQDRFLQITSGVAHKSKAVRQQRMVGMGVAPQPRVCGQADVRHTILALASREVRLFEVSSHVSQRRANVANVRKEERIAPVEAAPRCVLLHPQLPVVGLVWHRRPNEGDHC